MDVLTSAETEKFRELYPQIESILKKKKDLSKSEVIKSINNTISAISSGQQYPIPQSGNTLATEPAPTKDGTYPLVDDSGTLTNWGNTIIPDLTGKKAEIIVSGGQTVFTLNITDLSQLDDAPTQNSNNGVKSGGVYTSLLNLASKGGYNGTLQDLKEEIEATLAPSVPELSENLYVGVIGTFDQVSPVSQRITLDGNAITYQNLKQATDDGNGVLTCTNANINGVTFAGGDSNEFLSAPGYVEVVVSNAFLNGSAFYFGLTPDTYIPTTGFGSFKYGARFMASQDNLMYVQEYGSYPQLPSALPINIGDSLKIEVQVSGVVVLKKNNVVIHTYTATETVTGGSENNPLGSTDQSLTEDRNIDLNAFNLLFNKAGKFGGLGIGNITKPKALIHISNDPEASFTEIDTNRLGGVNADVIIEGRNDSEYHGFRWINRTTGSCGHLIYGDEDDYWEAEFDYDFPNEGFGVRVPYNGKTVDSRPELSFFFKKNGRMALGRSFMSPDAIFHLKDNSDQNKMIVEDLPVLKTGVNFLAVDSNGYFYQKEIKIFNSNNEAINDDLVVGDVYEAGSAHSAPTGVLITIR